MSTVEPDPRTKAEQLTVRPLPAFDTKVKVLGSKSYSNRYLTIASLSGKQTTIEGALISDDTVYLAKAIEQRELRYGS
jgi:3-phosphoshikimate 1-carboxyvinyltransferase